MSKVTAIASAFETIVRAVDESVFTRCNLSISDGLVGTDGFTVEITMCFFDNIDYAMMLQSIAWVLEHSAYKGIEKDAEIKDLSFSKKEFRLGWFNLEAKGGAA